MLESNRQTCRDASSGHKSEQFSCKIYNNLNQLNNQLVYKLFRKLAERRWQWHQSINRQFVRQAGSLGQDKLTDRYCYSVVRIHRQKVQVNIQQHCSLQTCCQDIQKHMQCKQKLFLTKVEKTFFTLFFFIKKNKINCKLNHLIQSASLSFCPNITTDYLQLPTSHLLQQEAFEKCLTHSPLWAAARPITRCRYCRTPPAHRCPRQRQCVTEGTAMAP